MKGIAGSFPGLLLLGPGNEAKVLKTVLGKSFLTLKKYFIFILYVCVASMLCRTIPKEVEEGVGSTETGVRDVS